MHFHKILVSFSVVALAAKTLGFPTNQAAGVQRYMSILDILSAIGIYKPNVESSKPLAAQSPTSTQTPRDTASTTNFSMAKILCMVNDLRKSHGQYPVVYHDKLIHLAQDHAKFQSMSQAVTHNDSSGQIGDRLTRLGFQWRVLAENVGAGAPDEASIMKAWANSPHHLANILHPDIRFMGVGMSNGYWVQDFAAPMDKRYGVSEDIIDTCPSSPSIIIYI